MMDLYKLDDQNNPVLCYSLSEWGELYRTKEGNERRRVGLDNINGYEISTVFLGIDHAFDNHKPLLFETMIFGDGPGDQHTTRCSTWKEALQMHENAIQWVKDGCKDE